MKILNQNITNTDLSIGITKISELQSTENFYDDSIIHIVEKGTSKHMTIETFKNKVYEAVQNTFKTEYIDTHNHDDDGANGWSFKEMVEYLETDIGAFNPSAEESSFVEHVNYDFEILRKYIVKKDNEIGDGIRNLTAAILTIDNQFNKQMILTTRNESNDPVSSSDEGTSFSSVWYTSTDDDDYCQMQIQVGNKISNEWVVPKSGILVICGWLDSEKVLNNKAISQAYCVIEGKINGNWEVIGVQPVIPNKSITYVGFTLPVREGLEIRARTGFVVGAKSGQFANDQDGVGSLSNSVNNGFRCQVYSNKNVPDGLRGLGDGDIHLVVDEMQFDEMSINEINVDGRSVRGIIGQ
jgi:hypothetical protein